MTSEIEFIKRLYERFNARDIEALLSSMSEDVVWANGMEGGYVHGRDGVRDYWTRQWAMISPRVDPIDVSVGSVGEILAEVQQVVHDLNGQLLAHKMVVHVFLVEGGMIKRFDIRRSDQLV
jgi:ketosteroid isomerase-like protein